MSWLNDDDRTLVFKYVCEDNHETLSEMLVSEQDYISPVECGACKKSAAYAGFLPMELKMVNKVAFDQNGRKAYKIKDGSGKTCYISQTKYKYMETGKIDPQYTNDYHEKLKKDEEANAYLLGTDNNRRMAAVKKAIGNFKKTQEGVK